MNKTILIGHLGRDPELKKVNDTHVCTASMATSEKFKNKEGKLMENTDWHNLVFWGRAAENIAKYCTKGSQLAIEGKNKTRSYDDKDGNKKYVTEILVTSFEFLGGGTKATAGNKPPTPDSPPENIPSPGADDLSDLPF